MKRINKANLNRIAAELAVRDPILKAVVENYGPPPLWARPTGFATLVHIILEQQVSLASARACFDKLATRLGEISPEGIVSLNDSELRSVGFSRQKAGYARNLADSVLSGRFSFNNLHRMPDDKARQSLTGLKGVGSWTADIYLLMAMLRPDVMPRGDLALHLAWRELTAADHPPATDAFLEIAARWRPYRSVAARILWHYYLSRPKPTKIKPPKSGNFEP